MFIIPLQQPRTSQLLRPVVPSKPPTAYNTPFNTAAPSVLRRASIEATGLHSSFLGSYESTDRTRNAPLNPTISINNQLLTNYHLKLIYTGVIAKWKD